MARVINVESKEGLSVTIEEVSPTEIKSIQKSRRFGFDWSVELEHQVFKLRLKDSEEILGLMAIID